MPKTIESTPEKPEQKALEAAVDRVYRKYGSNLQAFYNDVYKELADRRSSENQVKSDAP